MDGADPLAGLGKRVLTNAAYFYRSLTIPERWAFYVGRSGHSVITAIRPLSTPSRHTIALVDDDPVFRQLLAMLVNRFPHATVCWEGDNGHSARIAVAKERPDLLILDLRLPDADGLALGRELRAAHPRMKLLLLTAHPDANLPVDLLGAGFHGYLDKSAPIARMVAGLESVIEGGLFFASSVVPIYDDADTGRTPGQRGEPTPGTGESMGVGLLTAREAEVATWVARGLMSKQIADRLGLSMRTVEKHRYNIFRKLRIDNIASLTRWCLRARLLD